MHAELNRAWGLKRTENTWNVDWNVWNNYQDCAVTYVLLTRCAFGAFSAARQSNLSAHCEICFCFVAVVHVFQSCEVNPCSFRKSQCTNRFALSPWSHAYQGLGIVACPGMRHVTVLWPWRSFVGDVESVNFLRKGMSFPRSKQTFKRLPVQRSFASGMCKTQARFAICA